MAITDCADGLLGTWRLESLRLRMEDTEEVVEPFGPDPRGSIIFTPDGRMMTVITASRRTPPMTETEMAAAFHGMMAYTGRAIGLSLRSMPLGILPGRRRGRFALSNWRAIG